MTPPATPPALLALLRAIAGGNATAVEISSRVDLPARAVTETLRGLGRADVPLVGWGWISVTDLCSGARSHSVESWYLTDAGRARVEAAEVPTCEAVIIEAGPICSVRCARPAGHDGAHRVQWNEDDERREAEGRR